MTPGRETPRPPEDGRPGPLSLADPARIRAVLTDAGFAGIRIESVERPMHLGADPDDALDHLTAQHAGLLAGYEPEVRALALDRVRRDLEAHHHGEQGVLYPSACWLITGRAESRS